ncbi:MAG: hypothetical protein K2X80_15410 [Pseudomonadaceae bacterium]|nr:hypothetical protein [Pseudomonadaceae bacterium]
MLMAVILGAGPGHGQPKNKLFILWMLITLEMLVKACKHCVKIGSVVLYLQFSGDLLRRLAAGLAAIAQAVSRFGSGIKAGRHQ